jgi:hypothetical protein
VGTIEPRKNLPALVEAWREVRRRHVVDLVIAGRHRADGPSIVPEPGLHLPGEVPECELPALYSGAVALVCPSHYEGFGLPVLEAMQCGTCVIASGALREAAGDAALRATGPWRWSGDERIRRPELLSLAGEIARKGAPVFLGARGARHLRGLLRSPEALCRIAGRQPCSSLPNAPTPWWGAARCELPRCSTAWRRATRWT